MNNDIISFGGANDQIGADRPNIEGVIDRATLENLFRVNLNFNFNLDVKEEFRNLTLPLRFHYVIPWKVVMSKEDFEGFKEENPNYYEDERIFLIKGE